MRSDIPPAPRLLPDLLAALREDLLRARYTVERTEELLGEVAAGALRREDPVPARRALAPLTDPAGVSDTAAVNGPAAARDPAAVNGPAAVLFALFTLGASVSEQLVAQALPSLGVEGARELGILTPAGPAGRDGRDSPVDPDSTAGGTVRALVDLAPYSAEDDRGQISWWIASDLSELATGTALRPDHVLGVGGASLTLARISPRDAVGRVLDVGCGSGIQALHASRHAEHVIATDLSERALAFTAFNAALNQVEVELRQGSLLDPVAGETFDLIVSNPPFVITPRGTAPRDSSDGEDGTSDGDRDRDKGEPEAWTYRDGGRAGDTLLAELLSALPAHLAPGGTAVMLGNWERSGDEQWDAHPRSWLAAAQAEGLDCWVIQRESEDPAQYAETWVRDGGITSRDPAWPEMIDAWLTDFDSRDVRGIGFGYVLLRRPPSAGASTADSQHSSGTDSSRPGTLRTEQVTGTGSGTLSAHLAAGLRMIDHLARMDDEQLAASRLHRASDLIERRHLVPGAWDPSLIELVQGAGLARTVPVDQALAATVGALDGTLTLGQIIAAVCALTDADPEQTRERLLPQVRDLLITGMLTL